MIILHYKLHVFMNQVINRFSGW